MNPWGGMFVSLLPEDGTPVSRGLFSTLFFEVAVSEMRMFVTIGPI